MARFRMVVVVTAIVLLVMVVVAEAQLPRDANSPAAFLAPHNATHRKVGVSALTWNTNLERYTRNYALSQRSKCIPLWHSGGRYGENLFWCWEKAWKPNNPVTMWVNEQRDYKYSTNSCNVGKMCGHYSQVVWRKTRKVGCTSVLCNDRAVYIICSSYPPDNYFGQRPY